MTHKEDDISTETITLAQPISLPHNVQMTPPQPPMELYTLTISIIDEVLELLGDSIDD